jgi:hypothetical protein
MIKIKPIPLTPETKALARRIIWFEPPEKALSDPIRFVAYALERTTIEDMTIIQHYLSDDDLREVIVNAPPGIMTERSWNYWNIKIGRYPVPPLVERKFGVKN